MIDLYYWPTPNGWKITIFCEEAGLPYRIVPVDITRGAQFEADFLKISPNNRMPAIVDTEGPGGKPISVFESGAILLYLGDKTGQFLPKEARARNEVVQWLMFQMGGVGPMFGQAGHFNRYAPEKIAYAIERYSKEALRLCGVLDRRLAGRDYLADEYSVAEMAILPWIHALEEGVLNGLSGLPNLKRWADDLRKRPAVAKGLAIGKELRREIKDLGEEERSILFGDKQFAKRST